jgi:hypothetical protein
VREWESGGGGEARTNALVFPRKGGFRSRVRLLCDRSGFRCVSSCLACGAKVSVEVRIIMELYDHLGSTFSKKKHLSYTYLNRK